MDRKRKNLKVIKDTHGECTSLLHKSVNNNHGIPTYYPDIWIPTNISHKMREKGISIGEKFTLFVKYRPGRYKRIKVKHEIYRCGDGCCVEYNLVRV
jgi:hypothetical protein